MNRISGMNSAVSTTPSGTDADPYRQSRLRQLRLGPSAVAVIFVLGVTGATWVAADSGRVPPDQSPTASPDQRPRPAARPPRPSASPTASAISAEAVAASQRVQQRAEARWRALVGGDLPTAYQFELPSYRRLFDLDSFRTELGGRPDLRRARVGQVELQSHELATVTVEVTQSVPLVGGARPEALISSVSEQWLLRDGEWWRVAPMSSSLRAETPAATEAGMADETELDADLTLPSAATTGGNTAGDRTLSPAAIPGGGH